MGKWINCKRCGHEYSSSLSRCPNCNRITLNFKLISSIALSVAVVGVAVTGFIIGLNDKSDKITAVSEDVSFTENSSLTEKDEDVSSDAVSDNKAEASVNSIKDTSFVASQVKDNTANVSSSSQESKPTQIKTPKIGTEFLGDFYYITLPKYYLSAVYEMFSIQETGMGFNEYAYELDEDAKKTGFISAEQNSDGSATRCIGENKYRAYLTDLTAELLKMTIQMRRSDYIETVKHSDTFDTIDIKLKKEKLTDEEYSQIVVFGCFATEKQLSTLNAQNKCTVNLTYLDGKTECIKFPEYLK